MLTFILNLSLILNLFIITATDTPPYTPTDHILLNCGSPSKAQTDGRNWDTDAGSKFSPNNMAEISSAVKAIEQGPSVTQVPYLTARIIRSQFSYIFPVSPGKIFLRLYFYPASYSTGINTRDSSFAVTANNFILLSNFSASLTASAPESSGESFFKEFIIRIQEYKSLIVTFLPSSNSYAFVNGIEVVSTPENLYMGDHDFYNNPLKSVNNPNVQYELDQTNSAFEVLYRINIGGQDIPLDDSGMFRGWLPDDNFIWGADQGNPLSNDEIAINYTSQTPNYTAPVMVYSTARAMGLLATRFNLSWIFPVDSGFSYLLRLHFCEITPDIITEQNQRLFIIFINNITAEGEADVIRWANGSGIPVFRDFVVYVPNPSDGRRSRQGLFLALHPNLEVMPTYADAILNGLEIFKLNSSGGILAGANPDPVVNPNSLAPNSKSPEKKRSGKSRVLFAVIGGAVGGAAVILIFGFLIFRRRRRVIGFDQKSYSKSSWKTSGSATSSLPSDLCRRFFLEEIKSATANFNPNFVIGTGGFGNVYKGFIDNSLVTVAVKRLNPSSRQGVREFQTEIEMLSKLRHLHLVSLIGYCDEKGEMILVYDYMANGTLRDHLYKTNNPPLAWNQRLRICIGAAKGLYYLHMGAKHNIIHRDVKSTNILLDEKWVAKVSDFGLSKLGPTSGINSHISTQVKGSFGYVDPEYYKRQQLTDKSDVYSFGVVLLEVLCGKPAIFLNTAREQHMNLAEWAKKCYRKAAIDKIVDRNLKSEIAPECLRSFVETAMNCVKDQGIDRPAMNDVVWRLEFALQLQEAAGNGMTMHGGSVGGENIGTSTEDDTEVFSESTGDQDSAPMITKNQSITTSTSSASSDMLKSDIIFSEIMNPAG